MDGNFNGGATPKLIRYPSPLEIWLDRIILLMPGIFEMVAGLALLAESRSPSPGSEWLTGNGISVEAVAWLLIGGGALFVLYNTRLRSHDWRDFVVAGVLNAPLPGRVILAHLYSIQVGTLTAFGFTITWGLYALLLIVYLRSGLADNRVHGWDSK